MTAAGIPRVSFIVPAFNAADTLPATLASLARQTVADWEAVIIDDGSRDRTLAVARAAAVADGRIRLLRQRNAGASAARNRGLEAARGQFVAFLDADDWIEPDYLETLLPLADEGRAIAYCAYRRVLPSGRPAPVDWCPELAEDAFRVLAQRCEPAIHCVLSPRALLLAVGGFDATLRTCEDWDLWLRLARTGMPFRGVPRALASYRMRASSLSAERPGLGRDVETVLARARAADPRVPDPPPHLAGGWHEAPARRLEAGMAAQTARIAAGADVDPAWLADALGADWRDETIDDADGVIAAIERATADLPLPDDAAERLLAAVARADEWIGAMLADRLDLARIKAGDPGAAGVRGRWMAVPVNPAALPDEIPLRPGCDAALLRVTAADGVRDIALPMIGPLKRAGIAAALLAGFGTVELARLSRAWRSPRFWAGLAAGAFRPEVPALLANPDKRRAAGGAVLRSALARRLGIRAAPGPVADACDDMPVMLFDRIVPGNSRLLDTAIGTTEMAELFGLLADEGYQAVGIDALVPGARDARLPDRPVLLVFADADGFADHGVARLLPPPLRHVEVLCDGLQIAGRLPARLQRQHPTVRFGFGFRARRLPVGVRPALADAARWRRLLAAQGCGGVVPALGDVDGLADAVLLAAGFDVLLSPGSALARAGNPARIVPAIECSGAEGVGNAIECLRPAA